MAGDREHTAFCGLYCLDCIPSKKTLFETAQELENILSDLNLEKYAEFKSKKFEVFKAYPKFIKVLREIKKLECKAPCFEGPRSEAGCKQNCEIRACVLNKKYEGCWECIDYNNCELLTPLKNFHPGLEQNLEMIKIFGVDNWSSKRGRHYPWSK